MPRLARTFQLAPQFPITKGLLGRTATVAFGPLHKDQETESLQLVSKVQGGTRRGLKVW